MTMIQNELFFKRKSIVGNDIELIFHRDFTWMHNTDPLPVVRYNLLDCKNIDALNWASFDAHNDGVIVTLIPNGALHVFQSMDMSGIQFEIKCERIIQEYIDYSTEDLRDLLKEAKLQIDNYAILTKRLVERADGISNYLKKELENNSRKLKEANWLTEDKKQFLHGQNTIIQIVLNHIANK